MSLIRILALADRVEAARLGPNVDQTEELYRLVLDADRETTAGLMLLVPLARPQTETWRRNNLIIEAPPPERVVGRLPDVAALEPLLSTAASKARVFKAFGDGWGMSSAPVSRDWLVPMADSFDSVEAPVGSSCRIGPGARIKTIDRGLAAAGRALPDAPGYEELTFAGVTATGGHGSGLARGPLAQSVRSLELLTVATNLQPVRRTFDREDPLFPAVVTSLGALGIVTGMTLDVGDSFFIEETRVMLPWEELKARLPDLIDRQRTGTLHSAEVWINPYPLHGIVGCVLGTRSFATGPRRGARGWGMTHGDRQRFEGLCALMRARPQLIPAMLDAALRLTIAENVVMPSWEGLGFGTTNYAPVIASECAIALDRLVPTVEGLLTGVQRRAAVQGAWVTSPLGVRFVGAGKAWLSPSFGRETCTIEMPILSCTPRARETLEWFVRTAVPHGRPHWGQWNPLTGAELRQRYPRECTTAFVQALSELDPLGVFANDFVRDLRSAWMADPQQTAVAPRRNDGANCTETPVRAYSGLYCDDDAPARLPLVRTEAEVLAALKAAKDKGACLTIRSAGYSMQTHALRRPNASDEYLAIGAGSNATISVNTADKTVTVSANATWHAIIHETLRVGLLPPIVVTAPDATVGGTLACNSISQASRCHGHESDTLLKLRVALPGGKTEDPYVVELEPPARGDNSERAQLFRAVIRGFGHVGVIVGATYRLIDAPRADLPPVERCGGRGDNGAGGAQCVLVSRIEAFPPERLTEALEQLIPTPGEKESLRCIALFKVPEGWAARVTYSRFDSGAYGPHLLTYEGDTKRRQLAEMLLSTMPTAYVAGRIAAAQTVDTSKSYRDPACGYLFTMLPNDLYKRSLSPAMRAVFGPTIQVTFVLPKAQARPFLDFAFDQLRIAEDPNDRSQVLETLRALESHPELRTELLKLLHTATEQQALHLADSPSIPPHEFLQAFLGGTLRLGTLIPALFEMIWLPEDEHLLSSTYRQPGFAISLTFQGPGVNPDGFLENHYPYKRIREHLYAALDRLARKAVHELGGAVHLTKNVLVSEDALKPLITQMLGERLAAFKAVRRRFDERRLLTSAFGVQILGLDHSHDQEEA